MLFLPFIIIIQNQNFRDTGMEDEDEDIGDATSQE